MYKAHLCFWLLLLAACGDQDSGKIIIRRDLQDESAVSNGGNLLTALIHNALTQKLPELLEQKQNAGLLSRAEREHLVSFLTRRGIPIVPVDPIAVRDKNSHDRLGKKSLVRDGHLVNEKGEFCTERIVYELDKKRWVLEIDEPAWDQLTSFGKDFPLAKAAALLKMVFQYAHLNGVLDRSGEGPESLSVPAPPAERAEDPLSRSRKVKPVAGSVFVGEIYCPSIRFDYDALPKPAQEKRFHRCSAQVHFEDNGKATVSVVEKSGAIYLEYKDIQYRQDHIDIRFKSGGLERQVSLLGWGNDDVLELTPTDKLYRVDESVPLLAGKSFRGQMFCDLATEYGGLLKPAPWKPREPIASKSSDICDVSLSLLEKGEFKLQVHKLSGETVYEGEGRYEQIGLNVLLKHHGTWEQGYLWLCSGCFNHLSLGAGEFLWDLGAKNREDEMPEPMWGIFTVENVRLSDVFPETHVNNQTPVSLIFKFERFEKPDEEGNAGVVRLTKTEKGKYPLTATYLGLFREAGLTVRINLLGFNAPLVLKNAGDRVVTAKYSAIAEGCEEDCDEE